MDKNELIITTKIPIKTIINNVIIKEPKSECEFNNLLILEFSKIYFDNLENQQLKILNRGGSKLTKKRKNKKKSKPNKLTKKIKNKTKRISKLNLKGGADPRIIIFFITLFFVFSKGIRNMTDSDVIKRIKEVNDVSTLFKNDYGTCALNSLLFLKTIDLPTFEQLSIGIIQDKITLNRFKTAFYLNKQLDIYSKWYKISVNTDRKNLRIGIELQIDNYLDKIKNKLIDLRKFYQFSENQSIITEMNYPFKNTINLAHSIVIWLTSKNELIIIDPQKFLQNEIVIYSDNSLDLGIKIESIKDYIKQNVDLFYNSYLFESIHIELEDISGENKLEKENVNLQRTIKRIQETKEKRILGKVEEL